MLIDCVSFLNEYEMLEGRLKYLYDIVDHFIIVESDFTYTGTPKPFNFQENRDRYMPFMDKIIYLPTHLDYQPGVNPWHIEDRQRNRYNDALQEFSNDTVVMMSDCDEIPLKATIPAAIEDLKQKGTTTAFQQQCFWFNFDCYATYHSNPWPGTIMSTVGILRNQTTGPMRGQRYHYRPTQNGGYHLSYFFDNERISFKIQSSSHREQDSETVRNLDYISDKIKNRICLFNNVPFDTPPPIDPEIYEIFHGLQNMG